MAAQSLSRLPSPHFTQITHFTQINGARTRRMPCFASPSSSLSFPSLAQNSQNPWLLGTPLALSLRSSNPNRSFFSARQRITASISLSRPIRNSESVADGKLPKVNESKLSARAIKSFAMGELEARKLKYTNTGTEALLMGILVEGTSLAAKFLRAQGITLTKVKDECVKLHGKGEFFFFSPEHPPLTEAAQRALDWAVDENVKSGKDMEITASNLLLGVWSEQGSPGQKIMASLGFDDEKAQKLRTLSSESKLGED